MTDDTAAFWKRYFPTALATGDRLTPSYRQILLPGALSAKEIRKWIDQTSKSLDVSPTQWAKKANLAPSTVNRFLKTEGAANLSARTIEALSNARNEINREQFLRDFSSGRFSSRFSVEIKTIAEIDRRLTEDFEWEEYRDYMIASPVPKKHIYPIYFAFEIGEGLELPGLTQKDIVFGVPLSPFRESLQGGELILCHERVDGDLVRATLKKLMIAPDGEAWLVRFAPTDAARAIFLGDLNDIGFNEIHFASFLIVGKISAAPGTVWN